MWKSPERDSGMGRQEVWGFPCYFTDLLLYRSNEEKNPCLTYPYRVFCVRKSKGLALATDVGRDSTSHRRPFSTLRHMSGRSFSGNEFVVYLSIL